MPTKPFKSCPDGKERNPITKRCVRKCKSNRVRDIKTFKCIKDPLVHVVNPITERYVQKTYLKNIEKKQQRILQIIRKTHKSPLQKSPSLKVSSHKSSSKKSPISNSSSRLASPASSIRQSLSSPKLSSSKSSGKKKGSINSSNSSKKLSRTPSYQSSSRVFSDDVLKTNKVKKIQNFLRDKLTTNKNTLINRINRYNLLKPKLSL